MSRIIDPIITCFKKPEIMELESSLSSENDTKTKMEDKKVHEPQPSLVQKVSAGIFGLGSGAIGIGVGTVKWAASTTYNVGSGVVSATQKVASKVGIASAPKVKAKNE